jgi:hypothetical protein
MPNDAVIDYWADIYRTCGLQTEMTFEVFLSDPWRYLRQFGQESAPALIEQGWRPLLPAQAHIARELAIAEHRAKREPASSPVLLLIPRNRKRDPAMSESCPPTAAMDRSYAGAVD